jgi:hypothetical protein
MSDDSASLRVSISKGGRLIVCHAGSATTGSIPVQLIFHSKSKVSTDYHTQMTSETFKKWSAEQFIPYISPESVIITDKTVSIQFCWISFHAQT